ncbi:MAG: hypothetical protein K0R12_285 [Gammaproteobacteria bacterium]|jgi:DHA1 family bicyclomycin/chloramphenicol resistance-like MFS transporter|nr:hypothetical protein [Gammaproteobacteria bacterium]
MKYTPLNVVVLLAPLVVSFAVGQDIFVPEVPELVNIFHTSQGLVQLTLSLFMLAAGAGQLIIGPLSDRFGRKSIALLSLLLYSIASIAAALSPSIAFLIFARMIQGLGACGMMVCAFAMVRDLFSGNESAEIYSYLNGSIAISPLLAPLAGGYLNAWFGWRAPFFFLAILGISIFIAIFLFLSETIKKKNKEISLTDIFRHYLQIVKNRQFLIFTFIAASALAGFFTFFSVSPYILITLLHVPTTQFGYYFAFIGIIFFIGSITAGKLNVKIGFVRVAFLGCILFFSSGIIMFLWTLCCGTTVGSFILPMAFSAMGGAFMMGASAGGALEPFPGIAGTAAALLGASEFLFSTCIATITLLWPIQSNMPLVIVFIIFGALTTLLMALFRWG